MKNQTLNLLYYTQNLLETICYTQVTTRLFILILDIIMMCKTYKALNSAIKRTIEKNNRLILCCCIDNYYTKSQSSIIKMKHQPYPFKIMLRTLCIYTYCFSSCSKIDVTWQYRCNVKVTWVNFKVGLPISVDNMFRIHNDPIPDVTSVSASRT